MNILCYAPGQSKIGKQLQDLILTIVPPNHLEVLRSRRGLLKRLHQPIFFIDVAVLVFSNPQELREMVALNYLFGNLRLILILPDHHAETIALGHKLYPRFISFADSDLEDVRMVLKNYLDITESKNIITEPDRKELPAGGRDKSPTAQFRQSMGGYSLTASKIHSEKRQRQAKGSL